MMINDGNEQSIMGAASLISAANNSMQYQKNPKGIYYFGKNKNRETLIIY